ncbi:uncharacterized protein LOC135337289 isoform X3 [Halichondria panicea]|uniref:uncharacterized protein LOC135337289 isoform X3 n=1 Tax=Halichondria panicea TaxID=6063 RepID=UPI00312B563D
MHIAHSAFELLELFVEMNRCCTLVLLIACILLFCDGVIAGSFIAPPDNVTVYSGQMATFTCKVSRSGQMGHYWLITEERLQPIQLQNFYQASTWFPSEGVNGQIISSIALQMIGISETNNTSVECIAYYLNPEYILSDRVYLRVQGILDAPSNLASSAMNDSVLITWTPPSTLPGTTMSFRVNASVGDQSEIFTTSQHNFLIGLCDLGVNSSCHSNCELSVSVRSINQVGEGEPAYTTISIQLFSCDGAENDRPEPPTDLVANALDDSLSVSWSRPSSSHPISHYSMDVWDTQTESLIANEIEITDLKYTLEYMAVGIDTCNRSYGIAISVCAVNIAGKGVAVNTTSAIQQNMQSCPTISVVRTVMTPQTATSAHLPHHLPKALITAGALIVVVLILGVVAIIGTYTLVKRKNKIYDNSKQSIETGKNPSYEDASTLTKNPCYEEPPHLYESIDQVYNTCTDNKDAILSYPKNIDLLSVVYLAHENI